MGHALTSASSPNSLLNMPNVPGPQTSCVMSLSTRVQMFCPGTTVPLSLCFARIFSVIVIDFFTYKTAFCRVRHQQGIPDVSTPVLLSTLVCAHLRHMDWLHAAQTHAGPRWKLRLQPGLDGGLDRGTDRAGGGGRPDGRQRLCSRTDMVRVTSVPPAGACAGFHPEPRFSGGQS